MILIKDERLERGVSMDRDEYQFLFNTLLREISQLLEISGNEYLVRVVKKKLYDFSDKLLGVENNAIQKKPKNNNR